MIRNPLARYGETLSAWRWLRMLPCVFGFHFGWRSWMDEGGHHELKCRACHSTLDDSTHEPPYYGRACENCGDKKVIFDSLGAVVPCFYCVKS